MILLVGGAGYIGSHTVRHLQEHGYECLVLDNLVYGHKEAVKNVSFEQGDLMDKDSLRKVFSKYSIDTVIHFAAYAYVGESVENPQKYYHNNLIGSINLLDIMCEYNVKRIVFSSTCAVYGEPEYLPLDEKHRKQPISPYGKTKLMIEEVFEDYRVAYGLNYIALRYFNAAGAMAHIGLGESHNPETHLIPLVLKAIKGERSDIKVFGTDYETKDGTCIRDYIHVEDLACAHRLAAEKLDTYSGSLNLGTGVGVSVKDIIRVAEVVTGKKCPVEYTARRAGDPAKLFADNKKAREILSWEARFSSIENIIESAWAWEMNKAY